MISKPARRYTTLAVWITFVPILLVHGLFIATYPMNNRGGDTANYFAMLIEGKSSLVHAGGYPFLVGLPFRQGPLARFASDAPRRFDKRLQIAQHGILMGAIAVFFVFLRSLYRSLTAGLATLGLGTNLQLVGATSSTYPEWLQASLLILAGASAGCAFFQTNGRRKAAWYAISVSLFTWCFLVKFNAGILATLYLLPLIAEREPLWRKVAGSAAYLAVALLNMAVYQLFFHYPTTGTYRLTADTAWVLLTRVQHVYNNELSPSNGRATKRWLALASSLPMRYDVAGPGMFSHVDAVAADVRAPYRQLFEKFAVANDQSLEEWIGSHPIPEGFVVGVSVIPVCYYVGLLEGNDLGVQVAIEAITARPGVYARTVLGDFTSALTTAQWYPLFPTPDNLQAFGFAIGRQQPHGWVRLSQSAQLSSVPFGYRSPSVWWPGARVFGWLSQRTIPWVVLSVLTGIAVLAAAFSAIGHRRIGVSEGVALTMGICLVAVIVASCLTLEFRWKELCLAMPFIYSLAAIGLSWTLETAVRPVRGFSRV